MACDAQPAHHRALDHPGSGAYRHSLNRTGRCGRTTRSRTIRVYFGYGQAIAGLLVLLALVAHLNVLNGWVRYGTSPTT